MSIDWKEVVWYNKYWSSLQDQDEGDDNEISIRYRSEWTERIDTRQEGERDTLWN